MSNFALKTENGAFLETPEILADRFLAEKAQAEGVQPEDLLARLIERASRAARRGECLQPHELADDTPLPVEQKEHVRHCTFCQVLLDESQPRPEEAVEFAKRAVAMNRPRRLVNLRWKLEGVAFVFLTRITFGMVRRLEVMARHLTRLNPGVPAADAAVRAFAQRASEELDIHHSPREMLPASIRMD